ncbi:MAG: hypothetical protein L0H53_10845 [Candidatus Nitrosocosmicus sp.]|nr:hypothetical protein [Candidatus Nitrosocosmicus sp.]MDN5867602.1 hypothetical protein [Candidatus Nitrosocosmicus sp.]
MNFINHAEIRNILLKQGTKYRQSKIILGNSKEPGISFEINRLGDLRYYSSNLITNSVLLYED